MVLLLQLTLSFFIHIQVSGTSFFPKSICSLWVHFFSPILYSTACQTPWTVSSNSLLCCKRLAKLQSKIRPTICLPRLHFTAQKPCHVYSADWNTSCKVLVAVFTWTLTLPSRPSRVLLLKCTTAVPNSPGPPTSLPSSHPPSLSTTWSAFQEARAQQKGTSLILCSETRAKRQQDSALGQR